MAALTMSRYLDESNRRFFRNARAVASRAGRTDIGYGGEQRGYSDRELRSVEMIARFGGKCVECSQQFAAGTRIWWNKIAGSKHVECPVVETADTADDADALMNEYDEMVAAAAATATSADDLLDEYDAQIRARNLANMKPGIYRVELSGRRDTDPVNLKITVDQKRAGAFRFKQHESYDGVGRVESDGSLTIWSTVDQTDPKIKRVLAALDVLLGSDRIGKYGEAYARETGQCWRCGRTLKKEDSIDRGLGRHCSQMVESGY